jgi:hypothetical protein
VLAPGVYRESATVRRSGQPGAPITVEAESPGTAIITGADLITAWTETSAGSGEWAAPVDLTHFPSGDRYGRLAGRCEQVFVDGVALRQVLHRDQLGGGAFYYDAAAGQVIMRPQPFTGEIRGGQSAIDAGSITGGGITTVDRDRPEQGWQFLLRPFDPRNHVVEVTTRASIFGTEGNYHQPAVSHVVVRGLVFRASGDLPQQAMVRWGGDHLLIEDCLFEYGAARGFDLRANHSVVRRCVSRLNGQMGFSGYGDHNLVEDCALLFNNTKHSTFVCFEQGGCKIVRTGFWTLRRIRCVGNDGPGLWFDIDNHHAVIEQCWCEGNSGPGIMYEISHDADIRNNVCIRNGYAQRKDVRFDSILNSVGHAEPVYGQGILVQMSRDTRVYHNTCVGNRRCGIELRHHPYQQAGHAGHSVTPYRLADNEVFNNLLVDNAWDNLIISAPPQHPVKHAEVSGNRSDYNLFHSSAALLQHGGDLAAYARWGKIQRAGCQSLEEWRASEQQDAHSVQWDPFLVAPEAGDYRIEAPSPAVGLGRPVPGLVADYAGRPRSPDRPSAGAFEPVTTAELLRTPVA